MSDGGSTAVERARDVASRGEWEAAFGLLMSADAGGLLDTPQLPFLAEVAYAAGHLDVAIGVWERAHAACLQSGDDVAAAVAAVRVALHLLFDTALMAPVRGWLARAERLLEGMVDGPAHAWFAVVRTYERLLTGDGDSARKWARRAVELGSEHDTAAFAIGRVAEARLLILDGEVARGLTLLDEAGAAILAGDLDPLSTGVAYCELVCALQGLAQYDRAEEWTEAMERWCHRNAIGSLHGRCRVHRAEILRLRGLCDAAEAQALLACEELRPYLRRELGWPLSELGRIRLTRGDLTGAEAALGAAYRAGWDPQPGLALTRLAQGDVAAAAASIRGALEHPLRVPSKERPPNSDLQRAPLLEAQVEIEVAAGDILRARAAADELEVVAARFQSKALCAGAAAARGRVRLGEGDAAGAAQFFSEAARWWGEIGAPYEVAVARLGLAQALRAAGNERDAAAEHQAARTILDRIEAVPQLDQSGPVVGYDGLNGPALGAHNVFRREGDYWLVVFDDHTARVRNLKGMRTSPGFSPLPVGNSSPSISSRPKPEGAPRFISATRRAPRQTSQGCLSPAPGQDDEDIADAQASGDSEREAQSDAERDFLIRELARGVGLSGRDRRAGRTSERARVAVTRALRQAMTRIGEHHPQLSDHLNHAVQTGTCRAYQPDPRTPIGWIV